MPTANFTHHIYKLTRRATILDAEGRHAEADCLDRIVRRAQWYNPLRTWKNTKNWWTQVTNGDNPTLLLKNMQDALDRLAVDASKETWFAALDPNVRPTALAIISKVSTTFKAYTDHYNMAPQTATTSSYMRNRVASLAMGVARDCNDIIGLLGPLTDENTFKGGTMVYNQIKADLTTVSNLLTEQITPAQAVAQSGISSDPPTANGNEQSMTSLAPTAPESLTAVMPAAYQTPAPGQSAHSPYSEIGEQYMDQAYQRELHTPGSPEYNNEVNNYITWGFRNGGLQALVAKMQQDRHTPQFQAAVQQAWQAKGLPSMPNLLSNVTGR